jgi:ATP-dependent DNA ligase
MCVRFDESNRIAAIRNSGPVSIWLRPEAVAQIEFLEWTAGDRLRHSKFVRLREDKDASQVVKEDGGES